MSRPDTYYRVQLLRAIRDSEANDWAGVRRFCRKHGIRFIEWGSAAYGQAPAAIRLLRDLHDAGLIEVSGVDLARDVRVLRGGGRPKPEHAVIYDPRTDDILPPPDDLKLTLRVSPHVAEMQRVLGLSLATLAELQTERAMVVIPEDLPEVRGRQRPAADVFVAMPFGEELRPIYDDHIARTCKRLSLNVMRADDIFTSHVVMADVWDAIQRTKVVIADCTERNPNVFYEIGLAHVLGKHVILISQSQDDVPFDVRHIRVITYTFTPRGMRAFENTLRNTLVSTLGLD